MNLNYFYDKLLENLYDCNFTLVMKQNYRKNTVPDHNFTVFLNL